MYTSVLVCGVILAHFSCGSIAQDIVYEDSARTTKRNDTSLLSRGIDTTTLRTETDTTPEQAKKCGVSKVFTLTPLITNGREATVGAFPWHAGLYYRDVENNIESWEQRCGGSLITDRFVLTSALCVKDHSEADVRVALGKYFRSWDHYENTEQKRKVTKMTYPDDFNRYRDPLYSDIALLLLDEEIKLGEFVMPVCTGPVGDSKNLLNEQLFVVGWGRTTTELGGGPSETLRYNGQATIVPRRTCKPIIPIFFSLYDKICIKSNNSDDSVVQRGDSGGGLTVEHGGLHYLLGVFSIRLSSNLALFANATWSNHLSWIVSEVRKYDNDFLWTEDYETRNIISGGCLLPDTRDQHLIHIRAFCRLTEDCVDCHYYNAKCHVPSGSRVDRVKVVCAPGYGAETGGIAVCVAGEWQPPVSRCLKLCPPLVSETLLLKCRYDNDLVPCSDQALPGTTASFECQSSFTKDSDSEHQGVFRNVITCLQSGVWSEKLTSCRAGCGVSTDVKRLSPTILNGTNANVGFFPWHAGLYYRLDNDGKTSWDQKCGGSLITDRVVLTAAHCLTDVTDVNNLRVAFGKYYRSWDTIEPTEEKRNVSEIASPSEFNNNILSFDIALVLLSERIKLGEFIMPVCLDYGEGTNHLQNSKLYVVGWGKTRSTLQAQSSEHLLYNTVTVMSQTACKRALPFFYSAYEKFCAVKDNSESVTQQGDSGGGLTAVYGDGLHYVVGVVSAKINQTSLFTNVKYKTHTEWINFKIRQFSTKK